MVRGLRRLCRQVAPAIALALAWPIASHAQAPDSGAACTAFTTTVNFEPMEAGLKSVNAQVIDRLVSYATASNCRLGSIRVEGHLDAAEERNQADLVAATGRKQEELSVRRARIVKEALVARGLSARRIETEGLEAKARIEDVDGPSPLNRRVEITVTFRAAPIPSRQ